MQRRKEKEEMRNKMKNIVGMEKQDTAFLLGSVQYFV